MKKDFTIKDAVFFEIQDETIDVRGDCRLISIAFLPGDTSSAEIRWAIQNSNQQLHMKFSLVEDFIVSGRDAEYPASSGSVLAIAGFTGGLEAVGDGQFYVEPTEDRGYMSLSMNDGSAIFVKAESVIIRRV